MPRDESDKPSVTVDKLMLNTIRRVMPNVIANEIIGVQPMTDVSRFIKKWEKIGMDIPTDTWVYNIRSHEIRDWVEEQPVHMWKFYDLTDTKLDFSLSTLGQNYVFTKEMEVWFELRWG